MITGIIRYKDVDECLDELIHIRIEAIGRFDPAREKSLLYLESVPK